MNKLCSAFFTCVKMPSRKTSKRNFDSLYQAQQERFSSKQIQDLSLHDQVILTIVSSKK